MYMRTTADSMSSADTSARIIWWRSLELERVQVPVYGGAEGVHAKLLRDIQIKATIPADGTAPAINADLKLLW